MFKPSSEYGRRFSTSSLPDYRSSMPDLQKVSASSDDGVESQSYKSLLNQLVQKLWKQLPIYQTINEGSDHLPMFGTTVWFNGAGYKSPNTFHLRKMAEMDASRVTYVYMMHKLRIEASRLVHEDKYFCKSILLEYSARMKIEHPTYNTIQLNTPLPIFRCFLDFNDESWTGDDSWNKKEAEQSAARAAILTYLDSKSGDIMSDIINVKFKRIDGMKGINSAENGLLLDEAKVMKLDNTSAPSGPCLVQDATIPVTVVMNRTNISHGMKNISRAENGLFLDDAKVMKLHDTSAPLEPCLVQDATIPSTMVMNQSQTYISKVPISVPTPVVPVPTVSAQTPFATTKVAPSFSVVSAPPQSANIPATHTPTNVTHPKKSEASSVIPKLPTPPALDPEMYASIMSSKKRRRRNKKNAKKKMRFDDWYPYMIYVTLDELGRAFWLFCCHLVYPSVSFYEMGLVYGYLLPTTNVEDCCISITRYLEDPNQFTCEDWCCLIIRAAMILSHKGTRRVDIYLFDAVGAVYCCFLIEPRDYIATDTATPLLFSLETEDYSIVAAAFDYLFFLF